MSKRISMQGRAGLLVLALVTIGGVGCATIDAVANAQREMKAAAEERARLRRIDKLERGVAAGDPAAMVDQAYALQATLKNTDRDLPRIVGLLERAARKGNVQAQVWLAEILFSDDSALRAAAGLKPVPEERARAFALLKNAAAQACVVHMETERQGQQYVAWVGDNVNVAQRVVFHLERERQPDAEIALWHARGIVHCGQYEYIRLNNSFIDAKRLEERSALLGMILLTGDSALIANTRSRATPQVIEAAERNAIELRRLVTASEAEYPAPKHKELP